MGKYRNDALGVHYMPEDEINVDDEHAEWLLRDSPSSFERVKAMASPPANKAVLDAPENKAQDDLTEISGISRAKALALADNGISSFADLARADTDTLTSIRGVGEATAGEWIAGARERL